MVLQNITIIIDILNIKRSYDPINVLYKVVLIPFYIHRKLLKSNTKVLYTYSYYLFMKKKYIYISIWLTTYVLLIIL